MVKKINRVSFNTSGLFTFGRDPAARFANYVSNRIADCVSMRMDNRSDSYGVNGEPYFFITGCHSDYDTSRVHLEGTPSLNYPCLTGYDGAAAARIVANVFGSFCHVDIAGHTAFSAQAPGSKRRATSACGYFPAYAYGLRASLPGVSLASCETPRIVDLLAPTVVREFDHAITWLGVRAFADQHREPRARDAGTGQLLINAGYIDRNLWPLSYDPLPRKLGEARKDSVPHVLTVRTGSPQAFLARIVREGSGGNKLLNKIAMIGSCHMAAHDERALLITSEPDGYIDALGRDLAATFSTTDYEGVFSFVDVGEMVHVAMAVAHFVSRTTVHGSETAVHVRVGVSNPVKQANTCFSWKAPTLHVFAHRLCTFFVYEDVPRNLPQRDYVSIYT